MKKRLIVMAALTAVLGAGGARVADAGEMDLMLKRLVRNTQSSSPASRSWSRALHHDSEGAFVPCLLRSRDVSATMRAIVDAGGQAQQATGGGILSALVPLQALEAIVVRTEVEIAEAGLPLARKMDSARAATAVDTVQSGAALGVPYLGTNVVVGVVDDAIDYGHPDFLGTNGVTRVQYVRQELVGGTLECTKRQIAAGSCSIEDEGQGYNHGTHVTGTAAGANATYTGVAPRADIMFVFANPTDADTGGSFATTVLAGVTTIFGKADLIDKAAVVNLSLGTSIGAHDGTSLLEQGLSELTAAKGGRIVVNAAGNEQVVPADFSEAVRDHIGGIHAGIDVPAGESRGWRVMILSGRGSAGTFTGGTFVDLWLGAGQKDGCSVAAFGYTGGRASDDFSFPGALDTAGAAFATGDVAMGSDTTAPTTATGSGITASIEVAASDPRNAKPHATMLFAPSSGTGSGSALESAWIDVVVRSTGAASCSGNMWLYYDVTSYHDFLTDVAGTAVAGTGSYTLADGDSLLTTTIPATAVGVIAAGSFMPPKPAGAATSTWTGDNGTTYDQSSLTAPGGTGSATNDLSGFSSLGPTADGRPKPEVVAPGEPIVATLARGATVSSAIAVGGSHFKDQGTSMSSPHLAGIVALLLERNNTLTVDQVRTALAVGASTDGMTVKTPDPANSYGAGKVNAAGALGSVGADTSLYHGTGDLESPDGGGCSLATALPARLAGALALLIAGAAIAIKRRRMS